ncbi:hypothetical protein [Streptomyces aureus]|uniref:hypothetical protein n=1 Tax=Streptomyces aureus TaxID=193461 RepID=UPI0006E3A068|nr:hypothetical protein [Streptomyces aureus]
MKPQSHLAHQTTATKAVMALAVLAAAAVAALAAHTTTDAATAGDRETGTVKVEAGAGEKKVEVIKS